MPHTQQSSREGMEERYWNHYSRCIGGDGEYTDKEMVGLLSNVIKSNHDWNLDFIRREIDSAVSEALRGPKETLEKILDGYTKILVSGHNCPTDKGCDVYDKFEPFGKKLSELLESLSTPKKD